MLYPKEDAKEDNGKLNQNTTIKEASKVNKSQIENNSTIKQDQPQIEKISIEKDVSKENECHSDKCSTKEEKETTMISTKTSNSYSDVEVDSNGDNDEDEDDIVADGIDDNEKDGKETIRDSSSCTRIDQHSNNVQPSLLIKRSSLAPNKLNITPTHQNDKYNATQQPLSRKIVNNSMTTTTTTRLKSPTKHGQSNNVLSNTSVKSKGKDMAPPKIRPVTTVFGSTWPVKAKIDTTRPLKPRPLSGASSSSTSSNLTRQDSLLVGTNLLCFSCGLSPKLLSSSYHCTL